MRIVTAYVLSGVLAISVPFEQVNSLTRRLIGGIDWNIGFLVLLFPFIVWGILMVVRGIQRSEYDDEKNQMKYLLFGSVIAFFAGITGLVQKVSVHVPPLWPCREGNVHLHTCHRRIQVPESLRCSL